MRTNTGQGTEMESAVADSRRSVLLAMEEEQIAAILEIFLDRAGFRVTCAVDGRSALRVHTNGEHDLVVLDSALPCEGGALEVLRLIRDRSKVPVIMLLAPENGVGEAVALENGADYCMFKPFGGREFVERVDTALWPTDAGRKSVSVRGGDEEILGKGTRNE